MSEIVRNKARERVKYLQSLPEDVRERENQKGRDAAEAEHRIFQEHFCAGKCSICGDDLGSFDPGAPCVHWLLVPVGFTKRHFMQVTQRYSLFQIQAFLRWVANEDALARNINDLSEEGTGKLVELTIRNKDCEWAFSCGEGDYLGHGSASEESRRPHYHFQMRYKRQAFIRYNDFHIPLWVSDIQTIEAMRAAPGFVQPRFAGGEGMSDLFNENTVEKIVNAASSPASEEEALFKMDSFIIADEGTTIRGEDLANLFDEAKEKGVSVASLIPKLKNVRAQTIVTPGTGVVKQAPRAGRKRRPQE